MVDNITASKLEHTRLTPVSMAVRDSVMQPGILARAHGHYLSDHSLSGHAPGLRLGSSSVGVDAKVAVRHSLSLRTAGRTGLLRDVSLTLLAHRVDVDTLTAYTLDAAGSIEVGPSEDPAEDEDCRAVIVIEASVLADPETCRSASDWAALVEKIKEMTATGMALPEAGGIRHSVDILVAPIEGDIGGGASGVNSSNIRVDDFEMVPGADRVLSPGLNPSPASDPCPGPGMGIGIGMSSSKSRKGVMQRGLGGVKRAESIADLNRFQVEWEPKPSQPRSSRGEGAPFGSGGNGGGGEGAGEGGESRRGVASSLSPLPAHAFADSPDHPSRRDPRRNGGIGGKHGREQGSGLNRSFSVADMTVNVSPGGNMGGSGSPMCGVVGTFRPGMSGSILHAASSQDLMTMASAGMPLPPTLPEFEIYPRADATADGPPSTTTMSSSACARERVGLGSSATGDSGRRGLSSVATPFHATLVPVLSEALSCVPSLADDGSAPSTLLGGGKRFPVLPPPRRDRGTQDYYLLRELGRGLCGTVYLGREKGTGQIVAFKVMRKTKLVDVSEAHHAAVERKLHERISSGPFINRLLASFQDPWALFLVLEYAPCGDLFQAMNYHGLPSRNDAAIYAIQVATALEHLHALSYVYRDLKPENILLHTNGSVQLADFGMSKLLKPGERTFTICGTAQYMSPEVLLHKGCYFEADLWAMGIFIYELTTGDTPFSSNSDSRQDLYRRLMSHDPDRMALPNAVDRRTESVVKALLQNDEARRLGSGGRIFQLFQHPWFGGVDVAGVRSGSVTPTLSPRQRNVINDPALQRALSEGDIPWQRGSVLEDPDMLALFEGF